jgi:YD repeat-containing protein
VSANTAIGLVTYTINSLGQRVRKVTPADTTVFHYDAGGKLIAESTTTGSTTRHRNMPTWATRRWR